MEHRIFNRTFLKQTEVSINFTPAIDSAIFKDKVAHFLKSYFNVDISNETDANSSHLEILSDQTELDFYFEPSRAGQSSPYSITPYEQMDQNPNKWINGAILFIRNLCKYVNSVV